MKSDRPTVSHRLPPSPGYGATVSVSPPPPFRGGIRGDGHTETPKTRHRIPARQGVIWLPRPGDSLALLNRDGEPIGEWVVTDVPDVAGPLTSPTVTVTINYPPD